MVFEIMDVLLKILCQSQIQSSWDSLKFLYVIWVSNDHCVYIKKQSWDMKEFTHHLVRLRLVSNKKLARQVIELWFGPDL